MDGQFHADLPQCMLDEWHRSNSNAPLTQSNPAALNLPGGRPLNRESIFHREIGHQLFFAVKGSIPLHMNQQPSRFFHLHHSPTFE
jgi:hypothetical protein